MNKGFLRGHAVRPPMLYEMYYDYEEMVEAGHRILALNRGESEKILSIKIAALRKRSFLIWKARRSRRITLIRPLCFGRWLRTALTAL